MKTKSLVIVLVLTLLLLPAFAVETSQAQPGPAYTTFSNLTYCNISGHNDNLTLYVPTTPGSHPVVVWVPGGGWNTSTIAVPSGQSPFTLFLNNVTKNGIAVASIGYMGYPQVAWPSQIEEVKCAVRFLRAMASTYSLNPYEVGTLGRSVGGNLADLLGLAPTAAGWDNVGQYLNYPSTVKAVVDISGPSNLTVDSDFVSSTVTSIDTVFGPTFADELAGSPVSYMTSVPPAFLLLYGLNDTFVYPHQANLFQDYLMSKGVHSQMFVVDNARHGLSPIPGYNENPSVSQTDTYTYDFFYSELSAAPSPALSISVSPSTVTLGQEARAKVNISGGSSPTGTLTYEVFTSPQCTVGSEVYSNVYRNVTTVSGDGTYTSSGVTAAQVGTYYWEAWYSGDAANKPSMTLCGQAGSTESVKGAGAVTVASNPSAISVGQSASATATLSADSPTGTITFVAYSSPTCSNSSLAYAGTPVNVNGNGGYTSGSFTPAAVGTYYWVASYSGDSNNSPGSNSCGSIGSTLTVGRSSPVVSDSASPSTVTFGLGAGATAVLSGGVNPTGSVTFSLYSGSCSGSLAYTASVPVTGDGSYKSPSFTTTSTGSFYWVASYSGDTNNNPVASQCGVLAAIVVVTSIPGVVGLSYTTFPIKSDPTLGNDSITFSFTVKNFGTSSVNIAGSFVVASTGSAVCTGGNTLSISTTVGQGASAKFTLTCSFAGTTGESITGSLNVTFTDSSGNQEAVSGSPAAVSYTIEA